MQYHQIVSLNSDRSVKASLGHFLFSFSEVSYRKFFCLVKIFVNLGTWDFERGKIGSSGSYRVVITGDVLMLLTLLSKGFS